MLTCVIRIVGGGGWVGVKKIIQVKQIWMCPKGEGVKSNHIISQSICPPLWIMVTPLKKNTLSYFSHTWSNIFLWTLDLNLPITPAYSTLWNIDPFGWSVFYFLGKQNRSMSIYAFHLLYLTINQFRLISL